MVRACGVAVCGPDDTRGVGRELAWRLGHGVEGGLTSDVLAALYWPYGQGEQPLVQLESQESRRRVSQVSQPPSQLEVQPPSQLPSQPWLHSPSQEPPKKPSHCVSQLSSHQSQPELQPVSHASSQLEPPLPESGHVYASLRARRPHASAHGSDGQERARWGQADQLWMQFDASCRRARPPSTSPVIAESCAASGDESCALSSGVSTQPLDVESIIARWTSIAYCGPCICLNDEWCSWDSPRCVRGGASWVLCGKGPGAVRTLVTFAFGKLLFCGARGGGGSQ